MLCRLLMRTATTTPTLLERHRLANGLRLVFHPDRSLPLVTVNLWYHVGSKNEHPGRTGLAHLFEHMLFQGSQNVGTNDHFAYLQQVGGIANGSTSKDRTNYYETVPSAHLELALWLESDRMGFFLPALTAEKLENQQQVVMNERRERVDNQPYGRAGERLSELTFPLPHPYHWPIIGYLDDIAGATLEEVTQFFRRSYHPSNAVLTLAGDFDPDRALPLIERYFAEIPAGALPERPRPELPRLEGARREVLEDDVQLSRVYLAHVVPGYGHEDWYAADLLTYVLADGLSSRLHRDLVYRRQLAQTVSCYVYDNEVAAQLVLVATARSGVDIAVLEEALAEHLARAGESPFEPSELERAKNRLATSYYEQLQRLDTRADLLSRFATYFDDPGYIDREAERYFELSGAELNRVAGRYFSPDERVSVTVVPRRGRP